MAYSDYNGSMYSYMIGCLQLRKNFVCNSNCLFNIFVSVCPGHETSFVQGGCQVDPSLKHHTVPLAELGGIRSLGIRKVLDGSLREEPLKHTTSAISCLLTLVYVLRLPYISANLLLLHVLYHLLARYNGFNLFIYDRMLTVEKELRLQ
jgi:hypothetical protein